MNKPIQSPARHRLVTRVPATMLVVAALVSMLALPAYADDPIIEANPETLLFSIGDTTPKPTTITWDADDEEDANVYLSVNGGPDSLWDGNPDGSKVFSVQPGADSYLFCLREDRNVLACVTVTSSIRTISPGEGDPDIKLDFSYIHEVSVKPTGYSAVFSYATDTPSIPAVLVSKKSPLPFSPISTKDDPVFNPQDVESSSFNLFGGKQTSHANLLKNLDPDTTYHYVIVAYDETTDLWFRVKGTFKTLKRNVSVTFSQIKVLDDSDDLSAGEFAFTFFTNGGGPSGWPKTIFVNLSTGSTEDVNLTATVADAPVALSLKIVGYDDDELETPVSLETCGANAADFSKSEGENDCGEWTTAKDTFDVGPNVSASDPENFTESFTIWATPQGDDSEVSFKVTGSYSVSFS